MEEKNLENVDIDVRKKKEKMMSSERN